jgi:phosphatidylserine/phosphatidylglycerophosphate/cardiolipin synthase-like enzyme
LHEKLIFIDNYTAILGSYNPSSSAETKNDENLIIIQNLSNDLQRDIYRETHRIFGLT